MKKFISNNRGIALITALMLTLISMTIIMGLLYMITAGIKASGAAKKYKTSLEASYGGVDLVLKDIFPVILSNYSSSQLVAKVKAEFTSVDLNVDTTQQCLQAKLTKASEDWPTSCSKTPLPKQNPDISFSLLATTENPFTVYAKIIDTAKGNSDTSGLQLEGAGVAEGSSVLTPQHVPYLYRVEVQGERATNATEQANISALFAY